MLYICGINQKYMTTDVDRIFGADGEYKENKDWKVVHIPETYTAIAQLAFDSSCIEELSIPSSVTVIGDGAFQHAKIKRLMLPDWKYWCRIVLDDDLPAGEIEFYGEFEFVFIGWRVPMDVSERVFVGGEEITTSIDIPDTVKVLNPGVLCGFSKVEHIHLPNTISAIGAGAFNDCKSLKEINIPESVTAIWERTFAGCESLKEINIPESVTTIGDRAFAGCESLKEINIPESVTTIGIEAFAGCESLTKVVIPESVRCIYIRAFEGCQGLTTVVLTSGVREIWDGAFCACNNLRTVISLNPCPPECEKYAFDYRKDLTLYVPAGSVEAYANAECWNKFKEIKEIDSNEALNNY
jgi:hypothetical protein